MQDPEDFDDDPPEGTVEAADIADDLLLEEDEPPLDNAHEEDDQGDAGHP